VSAAPELLYLETDDEVTSVVRRLRAADADRVVLVAPGRSRATSSVVALRLLARVGEESGRSVAVVGDALTRSLATEAGLDAYLSVGDARDAIAPPAEAADERRAAIHVVRGRASDETAAVRPAAVPTAMDTETRPVPVVRPVTAARPRPAPRHRRAIPMAAGLVALALLLAATAAVGAIVLPAATITLTPTSEPIDPVAYDITIEEPDSLSGSVEATAPVTATGTYPIQAAATGTVVFFNWNFVDVDVPAGTLVAAGQQAFETTAGIVVPAGSLTSEGTIQAGEAPAAVRAAAVGPAANVPAEAIDTVLSENIDARLRGFPNNDQRRVTNPAATTGGVDTTGPEIAPEDVEAARSSLLEALNVAVADALEPTGARVFADPPEEPEPVIEGLDGLAGTRDVESAEISGTLAYDRLVVDRDEVARLAEARLAADASVLPAGHELLPGATEVEVGEARREGDRLVVAVAVTGASLPIVDEGAVIERVRGRSADDARAALADIGVATVELWPDWVASVPELDWRVDVRIAGEAGPSASGSAAP
jgi:hypothetical protein